MADWLRPVFGRTKTPTFGSTSTHSNDRQNSCSEDVSDTASDELFISSRPKNASRVSSCIGLGPNTPPVQHADVFSNIRSPQLVYHKPSIDQMAETLKVVMMTQNTMEFLPIQYNSSVLYLLEAYQDMRKQLIAKEEKILSLTFTHKKDIAEFESLAMQWERKEKEFIAQVKRLEVELSQAEEAKALVLLASDNRLVYGSNKALPGIERDIRADSYRLATRPHRQKERQKSYPSSQLIDKAKWTYGHIEDICQSEEGSLISCFGTFDTGPPVPPTRCATRLDNIHDMLEHSHTAASKSNPESLSSFLPSSGITKTKLEALDRQQTALYLGTTLVNSASAVTSSSEFFENPPSRIESQHGLATTLIGEMELPQTHVTPKFKKLMTRHSANNLLDLRSDGGSRPRQAIPKLMSFSFQPGDDSSMLSLADAPGIEETEDVEGPLGLRDFAQRAGTTPRCLFASKTLLTRAFEDSNNMVEDSEAISRYNTSCSAVTVVRDTPRRSSVNISIHKSDQTGRQHVHLNRNTSTALGSTEAIAAAARACKAGQKGLPARPLPGGTSCLGSRSQDADLKKENARRRSDDSGRRT